MQLNKNICHTCQKSFHNVDESDDDSDDDSDNDNDDDSNNDEESDAKNIHGDATYLDDVVDDYDDDEFHGRIFHGVSKNYEKVTAIVIVQPNTVRLHKVSSI